MNLWKEEISTVEIQDQERFLQLMIPHQIIKNLIFLRNLKSKHPLLTWCLNKDETIENSELGLNVIQEESKEGPLSKIQNNSLNQNFGNNLNDDSSIDISNDQDYENVLNNLK